MGRRKYYRVECFEESRGHRRSLGGFVNAIMATLAWMIRVPPDSPDFSEKLMETKDPDARMLLAAWFTLCDIPRPEIYENDKENHYCLYTKNEFDEALYGLLTVNEYLMEWSADLTLRYRVFLLEEKDILYNDGYQVVISKDTYDRLNSKKSYPLGLLGKEKPSPRTRKRKRH